MATRYDTPPLRMRIINFADPQEVLVEKCGDAIKVSKHIAAVWVLRCSRGDKPWAMQVWDYNQTYHGMGHWRSLTPVERELMRTLTKRSVAPKL